MPFPEMETDHDIVIKVFAAALNPVDMKKCEWEGGVFNFKFPSRSGIDGCGLVV